MQHDVQQNRYKLTHVKTVYTQFNVALNRITIAEAGDVHDFMDQLQERLDVKLEGGSPPDAPTLLDVLDINDEGAI